MLTTKNLTKSFGAKIALSDLSIHVEPNQILCLLGTNGAGKSTTLNLLLNFIQPDSGEIIIDGQIIDAKDKKAVMSARQKIAYIPEQVNLYQQFNAIENLEYLAQLSGVKQASKQTIVNALTQTGLDQTMWHKPLKDYSKGMKQKVGIAFAIIREAKVLLLDEPTSGLDPSAINEFINIIRNLAEQGAAVLMVTHDLHCAEALADSMAILKQGKIIDSFDNKDLALGELQLRYHQAIDTTPLTAKTNDNALTTQIA